MENGVGSFYLLISGGLGKGFGEGFPVLSQAFITLIPSFIWPDKTVENADEIVARLYRLPVNDYSNSLFSAGLADFGYAGALVVLPLALVFLFGAFGMILRLRISHLVILLMASSMLTAAASFEGGYEDWTAAYRNALVFWMILAPPGVVGKVMREAVLVGSPRQSRRRGDVASGARS